MVEERETQAICKTIDAAMLQYLSPVRCDHIDLTGD
jgi:hypothetical protein